MKDGGGGGIGQVVETMYQNINFIHIGVLRIVHRISDATLILYTATLE